jgi:diaminopimelate decarboxylase
LAPALMLYRGANLSAHERPGIPADKIMFSGIGKTAPELELAVDEGILCVNVESEPELELLSSIAASKARAAHISVRVNPDIDSKTHHKIATGKAENKFGIPISRAREIYTPAAKLKGLKVAGVDMGPKADINGRTADSSVVSLDLRSIVLTCSGMRRREFFVSSVFERRSNANISPRCGARHGALGLF